MKNIAGYEFATVCSEKVYPTRYSLIYHGTAIFDPIQLKSHVGLPARGEDIELTNHVEPTKDDTTKSAFRGTVEFPISPNRDSGAAFWAGSGGWVYQISEYPGYDINQLMEGKIQNGMGGFRSNKMIGEQEIAIPARVHLNHVTRIGYVKINPRGVIVNWEVVS